MPILNFVVHKFHKKSVKFQIICEFHLFFVEYCKFSQFVRQNDALCGSQI